jgi:hypothetical protein
MLFCFVVSGTFVQQQDFNCNSGMLVTVLPSDNTSLASSDSQMPYQKMDDSNSFSLEQGSYSDDRSETEALLRSRKFS